MNAARCGCEKDVRKDGQDALGQPLADGRRCALRRPDQQNDRADLEYRRPLELGQRWQSLWSAWETEIAWRIPPCRSPEERARRRAV